MSASNQLYVRSLTRRRKRPRGLLLYRGPSQYDSSVEIVAILTFGRGNRKTHMPTVWIILADNHPAAAVKDGHDGPICGDCPFRSGGGCYVNPCWAPAHVWKAYNRGVYPPVRPSDWGQYVAGLSVRIGGYGDPAAVPAAYLQPIRDVAADWTAYTHGHDAAPHLRSSCMASVETKAQAEKMQAKGWRTFRVRRPGSDSMLPSEVYCPSARVSCEQCGLCKGAARSAKSVVIDAHGPTAHKAMYLLD